MNLIVLKLNIRIILFLLCLGCASQRNTSKTPFESYVVTKSIELNPDARADFVLYGTMRDIDSKEWLIYATVKAVSDTIYEVKTDIEGNFKLLLPEGSYNLIFSYLGFYSAMVHNVEMHKYHSQRMDAFLKGMTLE